MVESVSDAWQQERLQVTPEGETPKIIGSAFYRGETCNYNPFHLDHAAPSFAERFLLQGWQPPERFISRSTRITTFGSCFAQHINSHLKTIGFETSSERDGGIYISLMGEGLVNVHSILQQFEWALENVSPPENLWHGFRAEAFGYDPDVRIRTREVLLSTDVFILTFGLSEIWYDEVTGGIFWRAVPMRHYDAGRHRFRVATFAETHAALCRILALIRSHRPQAAVVLTVSPVPLAATFRPVSCITANSASKALIRAALDELLRHLPEGQRGGVFYFPAFEAVTTLFPQPFEEDGRHCHPFVVPAIMKLFEAWYCQTELTKEAAEDALRAARVASAGTLVDHPLFAAAFANNR